LILKVSTDLVYYCLSEDKEVEEDLKVHNDEEMGADNVEIPM
jgi:hypothetical protein